MRKPSFRIHSLGAALLAAVLSGCSTPGPLHLYAVGSGSADVHDVALNGHDAARDVPSYLAAGDRLTGFAYDPFTDHFFLRLAPGNVIRVVDRPARKIKREFSLEGAAVGGGDLAVNPPDGHLFLIDPSSPRLIEATRFGKLVRQIPVPSPRPPVAIACNAEQHELLLLEDDHRTVLVVRVDGTFLRRVELAAAVLPSLAVDGASGELYAPLADRPAAVGVFSAGGALMRQIAVPTGEMFIDVGPHSFLRVF